MDHKCDVFEIWQDDLWVQRKYNIELTNHKYDEKNHTCTYMIQTYSFPLHKQAMKFDQNW